MGARSGEWERWDRGNLPNVYVVNLPNLQFAKFKMKLSICQMNNGYSVSLPNTVVVSLPKRWKHVVSLPNVEISDVKEFFS